MPFKDISQAAPGEPSAAIRERVVRARDIQTERYKDFRGIHCNAQMTERMIHQFAEPAHCRGHRLPQSRPGRLGREGNVLES